MTFQPLDLLTMIGFIMMIGIIVNHAILLVDRTRDALNHGHDLEEALRMALNQRLRAMVASTLTGALGALADGRESRAGEHDLPGTCGRERRRRDRQHGVFGGAAAEPDAAGVRAAQEARCAAHAQAA